MRAPDFDEMTKEEVIAWFKSTTDLSPMLASMTPATEPATRPETPMMLASIRPHRDTLGGFVTLGRLIALSVSRPSALAPASWLA